MIDRLESLLSDILEKSKNYYTVSQGGYEWTGIPDYYPTYKSNVEQYERIKVHADCDHYPKELIEGRAPNQTEEENDYIKKNYKCTTNPVFLDYVNTTSRGLIDANWSIEYVADESQTEDYKSYVEKEIKTFKSVDSYVKQLVPSLKAQDANGAIAVYPDEFDYVDEEQTRFNDQELFKPVPHYFSTPQIVHWSDDLVLVELHEKSAVKYGNSVWAVGRRFLAFTKESIWQINQTGKYTEQTFEFVDFYPHNTGELPIQRLKGVPTVKKSNLTWTSPFYYAVDLLDLALLNKNYLQVSIANSAFPFRVMMGDPCDFETDGSSCVNGKYLDDEGHSHTCRGCNGTGTKLRVSPMGAYVWEKPSGTNTGQSFPAKPVEYISPDVNALEFVDGVIYKDETNARSILHIRSDEQTSNASKDKTATEVWDDAKAMFSFVKPISDQIFEVYEFILDQIGKQRYGDAFVEPIVTYAQTFDFKTEKDYLAEIKLARESGAPDAVIHSLIFKFVDNLFFTEREKAEMFQVLLTADRLMGLSPEQITMRKAQGVIEDWEIVLHDSGVSLMNELVLQDDGFEDLELQDKIAKVQELAKTKLTKTTGGVENVLSRVV